MSNSSVSVVMIPWLHFGNTDYLIFKAWRPSSQGAIAGACIGLFLFGILERCLSACRRTQEFHWRAKTIPLTDEIGCGSGKEDSGYVNASRNGAFSTRKRRVPPFIPSRDIPRGVIQAIQSTLANTIMLVVMTFNGAYIISIILGLGIGEVLVGRIGRDRHLSEGL